MSPMLEEANADRDGCAAPYQRHRPERTLLYQIVEQHYPAFVAHMAEQERPLPNTSHGEHPLLFATGLGRLLLPGLPEVESPLSRHSCL